MFRTVRALLYGFSFLLPAAAAVAQEQRVGGELRIAARDLPRGHVLERADIAIAGAAHGHSTLREDAAVAPAQVHADSSGVLPAPGWITRRVIREGEPLRAPAVVPPPLVARGDTVRVRWRMSGVEISRPGIAMGEAALGESIQVRVGALHRVQAVATGPSTVLVQ